MTTIVAVITIFAFLWIRERYHVRKDMTLKSDLWFRQRAYYEGTRGWDGPSYRGQYWSSGD